MSTTELGTIRGDTMSNERNDEVPYKDEAESDYQEACCDGDGSDESSTSSSSSSTGARDTGTSPAAQAPNNGSMSNRHYHDNEDANADFETDEGGMDQGLLSNMPNRDRDYAQPVVQRRSKVAEKRQNRRRLVAGVAGGVAGLVMIGPCTAVAAGVAGAMLVKRLDNKRKQKQAKEEKEAVLAKNETELASLISPIAQV